MSAAPFTTKHLAEQAVFAAASIGRYPKRRDTVIAGVLAQLLGRREMTGLDAVKGANTTRLAAHVHRLIHEYQWPIEAPDIDVDTADGREAVVSRYLLTDAVIEASMAADGREFIDSVIEARAQRRQSGRAKAQRRQTGRAA